MSLIFTTLPWFIIWFAGIVIGGLLAALVPPMRWEQ